MNRKSSQKIPLTMITSMMSIFVALTLISCGPRLKGTKILSTSPYDNTIHSCYPTIKEIYESDGKLVFVSSWTASGKLEDHKIGWEIYNLAGERIYTSEVKTVTIRNRMSYFHTIQLNDNIKEKLQSGTCTVKLLLDDKVIKYQDVKYINESLINDNLNGAVILPFRFRSASYVQDKGILNTVTNAIYGEVSRIIKDTVPPSVAEEEIPYKFYPKLFSDQEKMATIKEIFPEDIFLSGTLELGQWKTDSMILTVSVYDARKGFIRKFAYLTSASASYVTIMTDLIDGILHKKGLLEYLRSL